MLSVLEYDLCHYVNYCQLPAPGREATPGERQGFLKSRGEGTLTEAGPFKYVCLNYF